MTEGKLVHGDSEERTADKTTGASLPATMCISHALQLTAPAIIVL
jgi:hypothetical protein